MRACEAGVTYRQQSLRIGVTHFVQSRLSHCAASGHLQPSRLEAQTLHSYTFNESRDGLSSRTMLASSSSAFNFAMPASDAVPATGDTVHVMEPYEPPACSIILIMSQIMWGLIVTGKKTLLIKSRSLKPKRYLIGCAGEIWGSFEIGSVQEILTDSHWRALQPTHCWYVARRPYKKTYALNFDNVESFTTSLRYAKKRGQNTMAKYRPASDVPFSPCETVRHIVSAPLVPSLMCEPMRVIEPYMPTASRRPPILEMKRDAWNLIVEGKKTLEINRRPLRKSRYHVGRRGELWGTVVVGPVLVLRNDKEWCALSSLHCWKQARRPYKNTYALMLCNIEAFTTPIAHKKLHGEALMPCAAQKKHCQRTSTSTRALSFKSQDEDLNT